jgi:hypothetical protein
MTHKTKSIDFLIGGVKSSPVNIGREVRETIFYVTGVAGDAIGVVTDVAKAVYSGVKGLEDYLNKDRA